MTYRYELEKNVILPAYNAVHEWLAIDVPEYRRTPDYIDQPPTKKVAAAHFDSFTHLHLFKAQKIIELLIEQEKLTKRPFEMPSP